MPWQSASRDRIMAALSIPVEPLMTGVVDASMRVVENSGGNPSIARIESYLDQLESLQETILTEAGNAGLIRADVIEWSDKFSGGKLSGLYDQVGSLTHRIAAALNLTGWLDDLGGGASAGRLARS